MLADRRQADPEDAYEGRRGEQVRDLLHVGVAALRAQIRRIRAGFEPREVGRSA